LFEIHTKHINTLFGLNVELVKVKLGLKQLNYETLKTGTEAQAVPDIHYI